MRLFALALIGLFILTTAAIAGQTVTVTSKDGKVTKQVVTTTTETVELDELNAQADLADAKADIADLEALADADITDEQAIAVFYYLEQKPFAEKQKFNATLAAEIARLKDLTKKLENALKK